MKFTEEEVLTISIGDREIAKRTLEVLLRGHQVITAMLDRAIAAGLSASYILMDSWFTL